MVIYVPFKLSIYSGANQVFELCHDAHIKFRVSITSNPCNVSLAWEICSIVMHTVNNIARISIIKNV